jgi:hypothetical protein
MGYMDRNMKETKNEKFHGKKTNIPDHGKWYCNFKKRSSLLERKKANGNYFTTTPQTRTLDKGHSRISYLPVGTAM